jgi:hypothetical protein
MNEIHLIWVPTQTVKRDCQGLPLSSRTPKDSLLAPLEL